jgi:hypothetical protein
MEYPRLTVAITVLGLSLSGAFVFLSTQARLVPVQQPVASSPFCKTCLDVIPKAQAIPFEWKRKNKALPHHWSIQGVHQSARDGCRICSAVLVSEIRPLLSPSFRHLFLFFKPATTIVVMGEYIAVFNGRSLQKSPVKCEFELIEPSMSHVSDFQFYSIIPY